MKINDAEDIFRIILSGMPKWSILRQILFNIFRNDLFFFSINAKLANFADGITNHIENKGIQELIKTQKTLEEESENAIHCFKEKFIIINPDKFQALILGTSKQ